METIAGVARTLAARLRLERPLAVIELAATGMSPQRDRIVELAVAWVHPDGACEEVVKRVNPGRPIPPEATARHGITNGDVVGEPTFEAYARSLRERLEGCDFAGFGVTRFDLPLLQAEFARAGIEFAWHGCAVVDAMAIYHAMEPRDLPAAVRYYTGEALEEPAATPSKVSAGAAVLAAQLERYAELPATPAELDRFCRPEKADWVDSTGRFAWREGEAVLTFGKHEGIPLRVVVEEEPDYLGWLAGQDLPPDARQIIRAALAGEFPRR